jgi:hypothetical protein
VEIMQILIKILSSTWQVWLIIIILIILIGFKPKIKGYFGEKSVSFFLSHLDKTNYKVINNLLVKIGDKTSQIDHVVVSNYGVFVIETKNYSGWIIGNEFDSYWKQIIFKRKEKLFNPIKQNYGHIEALRIKLSEFTDVKFISIIVFTTGADLKVNTTTDVVYTVKLLKTIKKYNTFNINDSIKEQIYSKLVSMNVDSKENRKAHVEGIHNKLADNDNKIKNDICPRCGGTLVLRNGKYGHFKGCSNYPNCRFSAK